MFLHLEQNNFFPSDGGKWWTSGQCVSSEYAYVCSQDVVVGERDYLRQELGMFLEQIGHLEKENAALSQELEEKKDTEEFKCLEEEFRKEHEVTSSTHNRR